MESQDTKHDANMAALKDAQQKLDSMDVPDDGRMLIDGADAAKAEPEITFQPGHILSQKYITYGSHIIMTLPETGESFNVGFRRTRMKYRTDRNKYTPHYGKQAAARNAARWGV